jgi:hypothetical protein
MRVLLFLLFLFGFKAENDIVESTDISETLLDPSSDQIMLSLKYLPQIFGPFNEPFLTEISKNKQRIEDVLRIDVESLMEADNRQLFDQFHEIKNVLNESLNSLMKQCQQFSTDIHLIHESEAENVSILIQDLNEDVINEANQLLESVDIFNERIKTLFQLSDDKFLKLRGQKLRESFQLYLLTFQDESTEFKERFDAAISVLNEMKEQSSVKFLYDPGNDEVLRVGSDGQSVKERRDDVVLEGLEELYVHTNNQEL